MQGCDGADNGGERLKDKEITTDLISGLNYARQTKNYKVS